MACRMTSMRTGFLSGGRMLRPCRAPIRRTSSRSGASLPLINWTAPQYRLWPSARMTSMASDLPSAISELATLWVRRTFFAGIWEERAPGLEQAAVSLAGRNRNAAHD